MLQPFLHNPSVILFPSSFADIYCGLSLGVVHTPRGLGILWWHICFPPSCASHQTTLVPNPHFNCQLSIPRNLSGHNYLGPRRSPCQPTHNRQTLLRTREGKRNQYNIAPPNKNKKSALRITMFSEQRCLDPSVKKKKITTTKTINLLFSSRARIFQYS